VADVQNTNRVGDAVAVGVNKGEQNAICPVKQLPDLDANASFSGASGRRVGN
jgi:hypothetical protein